MQVVRVSVHLPKALKVKIDALREQGTSTSWFIQKLVEQYFNQARRKPAT